MADKITFKQYLASKEALREAIKQTPKQTKSYDVTRYCNFVVGEGKDDRRSVNLKPKTSITIDWLYEDTENPTAIKVNFDGVKGIDPLEDLLPAWTNHKIQKWLLKNTT